MRNNKSGGRPGRVARAASLGAWLLAGGAAGLASMGAHAEKAATTKFDYPTSARVEYVMECMQDNGQDFANVYKCSCTVDQLAQKLDYDDFVSQSTFSRYATLGGEGGAEFRDPAQAKKQTKSFRQLQSEAYRACGIKPPAKEK